MREVFLGSEIDRVYIQVYLDNIRRLDPVEITTLPNAIHLGDGCVTEIIDMDRFRSVAYDCLEQMRQQYKIDIEPVDESRYYTAIPSEDKTIGGFHDPRSLGYQYWYHASFVVALNTKMVSAEMRTIEMIRNFLHDCLHHSTFRSYRRAIRVPAKSPGDAKHRVPEIYREQYGINFRNRDGKSYSSPELIARSPETINLNLLMDGVVVLAVADSLRDVASGIACASGLEEELRKEIILNPFSSDMLPRAHRFATQVTEPSRKFVEHWGKHEIMSLVLQAMMTGDLTTIKSFFREQTGIENAWEKLFRRPDFSLPESPHV
jgi:hypothetical protein